jgi:hypothetical protein
MSKIIKTLLILLIHANLVLCNDGAFFSKGDTFFPIEETTVQLKKEILKMKYENHKMTVNVHFEFYNPEKKKDVLVGFVSPCATQNILKPYIWEFKVLINGQETTFKEDFVEKTDLKYLKSKYSKFNECYYVYYFHVSFDSGTTLIDHSYKYDGDYDNTDRETYPYRLVTGTLWANHEIEDFEYYLEVDSSVIASVPLKLEKAIEPIEWKLQGIIKGKKDSCQYGYEQLNEHHFYFYQKSGHIYFSKKHFRPIDDLKVNIYPKIKFIGQYAKQGECNKTIGIVPFQYSPFFDYDNYDSTSIKRALDELTYEEIRIVKNVYFAIRGYKFKSQDLREYFDNFIWYIPDDSIEINNIIFKNEERKIINSIIYYLNNFYSE